MVIILIKNGIRFEVYTYTEKDYYDYTAFCLSCLAKRSLCMRLLNKTYQQDLNIFFNELTNHSKVHLN